MELAKRVKQLAIHHQRDRSWQSPAITTPTAALWEACTSSAPPRFFFSRSQITSPLLSSLFCRHSPHSHSQLRGSHQVAPALLLQELLPALARRDRLPVQNEVQRAVDVSFPHDQSALGVVDAGSL